MKVKKLIEQLKNCNQKAEVFMEGCIKCDCVNGIKFIEEKHEANMHYVNEEDRVKNNKGKIKDVLLKI